MNSYSKFYLFLLIAFGLKQSFAQSFVDSLKTYYTLNITEDERSEIIKKKVLNFYLNKDPDSLLILAKKNLDFAKESGHNEAIANAKIGLGTAKNVIGQIDDAFALYFEALKIFESVNNSDKVALTYSAIGNTYGELEDRKKSIEYYGKALAVKEKLNHYDYIYYTIKINQAIAAGYIKNYQLCFNNLFTAKAYFKDNNLHLEALVEGNIGHFYTHLHQDKQVELIIKTLKIPNKQMLLDSALYYHSSSLKKAIPLNYEVRKAYCYFGIGEAYRLNLDYKKALFYYKKTIQKADSLNNLELKMKSAKSAYLSALKHNEPLIALEFYKQHITVRDSLISVKNKNASIKQELLYEHEKDKLKTKQENANRMRIFKYGFVVLTLLFITIYLYRSRRYSIKDKKKQEKFSQDLINAQEEERTRVARDLHDSVGQQLMLLTRQTKNSGNTTMEVLATNTLAELRNISQGLHPASLERLGFTTAVQDMIDELGEHISIFLSGDIENIDDKINKNIALHLYRIIQEILSNIIKHAQAKAASVTIKTNQKQIHVSLKDNGKGFNYQKQLKTSKSLGMKSISERCKIIKAKFEVNSNKTIGSEFIITIPYI